ncbi:MAG: tyrosinase family protein [Candidatus Acidiferrum sp.]
MFKTNSRLTRRHFLKTAIAAVGAAALPVDAAAAQDAAKYTRHNVMSDGGKKALASYAKGVEAMLKLPADHPQNWFRNAFIHVLDCPHGNWWFYVWHRGYLGYFEQTIRNLSGDDTFAMPYWDWTTLPQIPDSMFDGVLTPHDVAFEPYTSNLALFTSLLQPALMSYWKSLNSEQRAQLNVRGYTEFDSVWNDVTGYDPHQADPHGISGNMAYANPCGSRFLTRDNPKLDEKTAYNVSPFVVYSGLLPTDFYNPQSQLSFNSSKTASHNSQPDGGNVFSVLEGLAHNKVHNYIGGVGLLDPGPYGNMTNFLSPVDPIFFLHHANMDRLWDVWTRKQKRLNLPYLPTGKDLEALSNEPFLFYVNGKGDYVGSSHAGEYFSTEKFEYNYEPGFGEKVVEPPSASLMEKHAMQTVKGTVKGNSASIIVPADAIQYHLGATIGASLVAQVTLPHPSATSSAREFDVIVGAPADMTEVAANSPYYAGTIAFFGKMMNMKMISADATFAVPLPKAAEAFHSLAAAKSALVNIRVVASQRHGGKAPVLKAASIRAL